ncbi:MAG: hypothetical protein JSS02_30390 [Planctomycetes bacterium]|nr:hypothetical protein [Planctomycetota bacterium]
MRSASLALTWELLASGGWKLLGAVLVANALPILILGALRQEGVLDPQEQAIISMHVVSTMINGLVFGTALAVAAGSVSRLYCYPISSALITAGRMLPAQLLLFAEVAASTLLLNWLFGVNWPILGPALFIVSGLATFQAVAWLTGHSLWSLPAILIVGGLQSVWFVFRYRTQFTGPAHEWLEVRPMEWLTLAVFTAGAYAVALLAIQRDRRGEALRTDTLKAWLESLCERRPALKRGFPSPLAAHFWAEWHQKGVMPLITAIGLCLGLGIWLLFVRQADTLHVWVFKGGWFLPITGFVGALAIGGSGLPNGAIEMGPFLATRPLSNAELGRNLLQVVARNVCGGVILWLGACTVVIVALKLAGADSGKILPVETSNFEWWQIPAIVFGSWWTTSLLTTLLSSGRSRFVVLVIISVSLLPLIPTILGRWMLSEGARPGFRNAIGLLASGVAIVTTIWACRSAWQRRYITGTSLLAAVALATTLTAAGGIVIHQTTGWTSTSQLILTGLAAITILPVPGLPLMIAWNRHR